MSRKNASAIVWIGRSENQWDIDFDCDAIQNSRIGRLMRGGRDVGAERQRPGWTVRLNENQMNVSSTGFPLLDKTVCRRNTKLLNCFADLALAESADNLRRSKRSLDKLVRFE